LGFWGFWLYPHRIEQVALLPECEYDNGTSKLMIGDGNEI
jgi:hypothetical protein